MKKSLAEWDLKCRTAEKDNKILQSQLQINQQKDKLRNKNSWIAGISAGTLLLAALLVILFAFYRISRHKHSLQSKQMSLLRQQQEIEQLKAMMEGEEKERARIARELHDGIGGMLAALKMNISNIHEKQKNDADKAQLNKALNMLSDTSSEVRKTAHNLLPDILTRHRLEEALLIYCENINISNALQVQFQFHAQTDDLDKSIELILYRITQELLQNILKHAHATMAWLMIKQLNNKLSIIVEDNGIGFNPEDKTNTFGLLNLQHRISALQGSIDIQSSAERGTTVHVEFDLEQLKKKSSPI